MNNVGLLLKKTKELSLRFKPFLARVSLKKIYIDDIVDEHDFLG